MTRFDRFAEKAEKLVAQAPFFCFCIGIVIVWLIGLPFAGFNNDIYHLALNSPTTAITFLLVALIQNAQRRFENTVNEKLNAIAKALALFSENVTHDKELSKELRKAVNLEEDMSA